VIRALALAGMCCVLGPAVVRTVGATPQQQGSVVRVEHRDPAIAPTRGPTTALVTVELFFVPRTNLGAAVVGLRALEKLQAKHPARIRLVYRILKGSQPMLSIAVLEAHAQGRFAELIDVLHTDRSQQLPKEKIVELAKRANMNEQRLLAALAESRYEDVFDGNDRRLKRLVHQTNQTHVALFNARPVPITSPSDTELERQYNLAYDRARELLDRGVPHKRLQQAFEDQALRPEQPFVPVGGRNADDGRSNHKLAKPPLRLAGLPAFGKAKDAIPVVLLCHPNNVGCHNLMRVLRTQQSIYPDEVRIVWAPWFDVTQTTRAAELTLLGDAALCAETVGTSPDDFDASPGWVWVNKVLETINRQHGRQIPAEKLIDLVAADLDVDTGRMSACRARMANSTLNWIEGARKSGVSRSPALVIGGRIYEGLSDPKQIQELIEAELAPGVLGRCATIGCSTD
jgi:protein-disulfide isomerase